MKQFSVLLAIIISAPIIAQTPDTVSYDRVFRLGEVVVLGRTFTDSINVVTHREMEKLNRVEVSHALNILPGISLANVGPRNESVVYVRGFDLRQVPVFIDGVPVYVPYDGYVDLSRFTTFDLAEVNVSKGFSSIMYGANTMGGAINLVSRRPREKFEISGRAGILSGDGYRWNVNAGSNLGKFYFQLGASQLSQDYFPLSDDYTSSTFEDGGERENAYRNDVKFSLKAGFTPNETDEYVIGYSNQHGEKGTPPYVGNDTNIRTRFWQWPEWNKQSLYFVSNTTVNKKNVLKTRLYYDTFVNELFSYDDETYSSMTRPYAFQSYYDDFTYGGVVQLESRWIAKNLLQFGVQLKHDVHRENNLGEPQRTFTDNTWSIGIENTYQVTNTFALVPGVSFNARNSIKAQDYDAENNEVTDFPSNNNDAVNVQLGMFWDINTNHSLQGTIARKTRFATIKDRYSYRMGQAIPNPDLGAEVATNYDLSYTGKLFSSLILQASLFRSDITDIIQQVDNVEPGRFQLQNAGDAVFYGYEINVGYKPFRSMNLSANYSYIQRRNETNPDILFTNVPDHKIFGSFEYNFLKRASILMSLEYNSDRYSTSYGIKVDGYTLVNAKADFRISRFIAVEGGVNNIFDVNYSLMEGFPEAGRNYFINLVFGKFN